MPKLTDTRNVSLYEKHALKDASYYSVPAFGDGNCVFNAFALCLADLIKRDQLILNGYQQRKFVEAIQDSILILKDRLKLYRGQTPNLEEKCEYDDIADHLAGFINFVSHDSLSYQHLIKFIKNQHSRHAIAALQVGLAPALRQLGVDAHIQSLQNIGADQAILDEVFPLYKDGVDAGHAEVTQLAQEFGVNLTLYDKDNDQYHVSEIAGPAANMLASSNHFDCLIPVEQVRNQQGITANLPNQGTLKQIENLDRTITELKLALYLSKDDLTKTAALVDQASNMLQDACSVQDAKKIAILTTNALAEVRSKLNLSNVQLKTLGVKSDVAKTLLQKGTSAITSSMSQDEAIARALQNAEILSFYGENYATLGRSRPHLNYRGDHFAGRARSSSGLGDLLDSSDNDEKLRGRSTNSRR